MDITITLTDEQAAALTTGRLHPMFRQLMRRGQPGNPRTEMVEPTTPQEFVQNIITGIAEEGIRRSAFMKERKEKDQLQKNK